MPLRAHRRNVRQHAPQQRPRQLSRARHASVLVRRVPRHDLQAQRAAIRHVVRQPLADAQRRMRDSGTASASAAGCCRCCAFCRAAVVVVNVVGAHDAHEHHLHAVPPPDALQHRRVSRQRPQHGHAPVAAPQPRRLQPLEEAERQVVECEQAPLKRDCAVCRRHRCKLPGRHRQRRRERGSRRRGLRRPSDRARSTVAARAIDVGCEWQQKRHQVLLVVAMCLSASTGSATDYGSRRVKGIAVVRDWRHGHHDAKRRQHGDQRRMHGLCRVKVGPQHAAQQAARHHARTHEAVDVAGRVRLTQRRHVHVVISLRLQHTGAGVAHAHTLHNLPLRHGGDR
mmetsp:Transcript_15919/g.55441  ORF Transcript_15919/g.55441 Transcript_15919/m.55441 type:complete len:340 (+) Transcript_15919:584-1603(+)